MQVGRCEEGADTWIIFIRVKRVHMSSLISLILEERISRIERRIEVKID